MGENLDFGLMTPISVKEKNIVHRHMKRRPLDYARSVGAVVPSVNMMHRGLIPLRININS